MYCWSRSCIVWPIISIMSWNPAAFTGSQYAITDIKYFIGNHFLHHQITLRSIIDAFMCQVTSVLCRRCRHLSHHKPAIPCYVGFNTLSGNCREHNNQTIRKVLHREFELCVTCQGVEQYHIFNIYSHLQRSLRRTAREENWPPNSVERVIASIERDERKEATFYAGTSRGASLRQIRADFEHVQRVESMALEHVHAESRGRLHRAQEMGRENRGDMERAYDQGAYRSSNVVVTIIYKNHGRGEIPSY